MEDYQLTNTRTMLDSITPTQGGVDLPQSAIPFPSGHTAALAGSNLEDVPHFILSERKLNRPSMALPRGILRVPTSQKRCGHPG